MISLPSLGIGCAAMSILSAETDDEAVESLLVHAISRGVRYLDVAPLYGGGRGEVLIGRALARVTVPVIVSTKVGYAGAIPYGGRQAPADRRKDFSSSAIERGVTDSLRRLNRNAVDIVFLHDPAGDLDDMARTALVSLERLREQGLIGGIGVGVTNIALANAVLDRLPIAYLLLAGRYTLLDQTGEAVINRCGKMGVQLIAGGIFNSGLLAENQPGLGGSFDYAPALPKMTERAAAASRLCSAAGIPLKAAALQFARRNPSTSTTLLGPRTRPEFDELMDLLDLPIPQSLWDELACLGRQDAPP